MRTFIVIPLFVSFLFTFGDALVNGNIAYNNRNQQIGTVDADGTTVRDGNNNIIGRVNAQGRIISTADGTDLGTRGYEDRRIAYDGNNAQIGVVGACDHIWRNGQDIGYLADDNRTVLNSSGQQIGRLPEAYYADDHVYDANGNDIGVVGEDNRTVYRNGQRIGYLDADGTTVRQDNTNNVLGTRRNNDRNACGTTGTNTGTNGGNTGTNGANTGTNGANTQYVYGNDGSVVGTIGNDGRTVYDRNGNSVGYMDGNTARLNNGAVYGYRYPNGANGGTNGGTTGANTQYVYGNDGSVVGSIGNDGRTVYDRNGNAVGYMDGNTARLNNGAVYGYRYPNGANGGATGGVVPIGPVQPVGGVGTGGVGTGGVGTGGVVPIGPVQPVGGSTATTGGAYGLGNGVYPLGGVQSVSSGTQFSGYNPYNGPYNYYTWRN